MYIYTPALEASASTVFVVWQLARFCVGLFQSHSSELLLESGNLKSPSSKADHSKHTRTLILCVCVFRLILKINSDYFPKQLQLIGLYNAHGMCLL